MVEHQPAAQRKFEEVKQEIGETLRRREAATLAQKDGMAKLEQLRKGEDAGLNWSAPRTVSRRDAQGLPPELLRQVVAADVSKLPAYVGVPSQRGGYVPAAHLQGDRGRSRGAGAAMPGSAPPAALGAAQYQAYVASLRSRADIERRRALNPPAEKK